MERLDLISVAVETVTLFLFLEQGVSWYYSILWQSLIALPKRPY